MAIKEQQRKFVSNSSESIRMFKAGWMEVFSKVHFTVPLILYIPVVSWMLWQWSGSWLNAVGLFAAGLFAWTLNEYVLHRFIFHWVPPGKWGERLHFVWHGVHHDYPNDRLRLVMPPSLSIPLAFIFFLGFQALMGKPTVYPVLAAHQTTPHDTSLPRKRQGVRREQPFVGLCVQHYF
jgi:sterol desaturase/sphingolipid hydroxylase (fatty acid hydroxylase superfamily)